MQRERLLLSDYKRLSAAEYKAALLDYVKHISERNPLDKRRYKLPPVRFDLE